MAAACGLAAQEVASGLVPGATSLVTAVGDAVVDRTPTGLREQAIESVGQRDKPLLVLGVLVVPVLLGALLASARGPRGLHLFTVGAAALSLIGGAAATQSQGASAAGVGVAAGVAFVAAVGAAVYLRGVSALPVRGADEPPSVPGSTPPRRWFLTRLAGLSAATAVGAAGAHLLTRRAQRSSEAQRERTRLRPVTRPLPLVPEAAHIPGLGPVITPVGKFYRITPLFGCCRPPASMTGGCGCPVSSTGP